MSVELDGISKRPVLEPTKAISICLIREIKYIV